MKTCWALKEKQQRDQVQLVFFVTNNGSICEYNISEANDKSICKM